MEQITLDLIPNGSLPVLHASQYDEGRQWQVNLKENGEDYTLSNETIVLDVRKGDGCAVTCEVAIESGKKYVILTSTEQMCAVAGQNIAELQITKGNMKIGTLNFILQVERDPLDGSISSDSEIHDLQHQVDECVDNALADLGASGLPYDNTESGLEATNVQAAIDEVNEKASGLPSDVYTKEETDALLDNKADKATLEADYYDKAETDALLSDKADASALGDYYTKSETDAKVAGLIDDESAASDKTWSSEKIAAAVIVSQMPNASQVGNSDLVMLTQPNAQAETGYSTAKTTVGAVATKIGNGIEFVTDLSRFNDKTLTGAINENKDSIDGVKTIVDSVTEIHSEDIRTAISPFTLTAGYISANGTVSTSTSYKYSQKIAVNEGDKIYVYNPHDNYIASYRFVCCYYNGSAVEAKGGQNFTVPFVVPSGVDEVVVSIANNQNPTRAELGTTQSKKELVNQPDVNALVKISANAKANSIFYGFDYTAGNTFETVEYYEDLCSYKVSFYAKISSITGIAKVGKGIGKQYGGGIGFDDTNLYMYQNTSSTPTQTQAHGLILKDYVSITLDSDYTAQLKVTITTNGGTYTWTISPWFANTGSLSFTANDNMSECKLSYTCVGLTKDTWLYGDSYFSNYDGKRWTYYLVNRGYRNYLLNAYGGRASRNALGSLKLDLKMNRVPRRIIWCMGMNDKDGDSSANASWQACVEEVMSICSSLNIELILATIPNVPSTDAKNDYKNAYVVASGYRYIDFAKAVSLNGDSTWYDDMLASDNIHPKTQGALALYSQAVATVPELLL